MADLVWDDNLATVAQNWAATCDFSHNSNRSSEYNTLAGTSTVVGENLFLTTAGTVTPYDAVPAWESESQFYDYASNKCQAGQTCGHYTQLVWRSTLRLGCGSAFCATVANGPANSTIMVCNYEPAGNIIGQQPY